MKDRFITENHIRINFQINNLKKFKITYGEMALLVVGYLKQHYEKKCVKFSNLILKVFLLVTLGRFVNIESLLCASLGKFITKLSLLFGTLYPVGVRIAVYVS